MQPKEIYLIKTKFQNSTDARPCVILDSPVGQNVTILFISSALDLRKQDDLLLDKNDPDFHHTGLTRTSLVKADPIYTAKVSEISKNKLGELKGELGKKFEDWIM